MVSVHIALVTQRSQERGSYARRTTTKRPTFLCTTGNQFAPVQIAVWSNVMNVRIKRRLQCLHTVWTAMSRTQQPHSAHSEDHTALTMSTSAHHEAAHRGVRLLIIAQWARFLPTTPTTSRTIPNTQSAYSRRIFELKPLLFIDSVQFLMRRR